MRLFSILLWGSGIISAIFLFAGISVYGVYLLWVLFCKQDHVARATFVEPEAMCELVTVDLSDEQHEDLSTDSETDAETEDSTEAVLYSDESALSSIESY